MAGVFGTAALTLCCLLLAATQGRAQSPLADPTSAATPAPSPGIAQPFELNRILHDAGFTPLGPPQREGTTYVLRAINFREVLMRVVVDGRSGAIRAINRIVAAKPNGVVGMMPPDGAQDPRRFLPGSPLQEPSPHEASPYKPLPGPPPRAPPADATPTDTSGPSMSSKESALNMPSQPSVMQRDTYVAPMASPPLPRPRPSELTLQKTRLPEKMLKVPAAKPRAVPAAASVETGPLRRAPTTRNGVPQIATPD